MEKRVNEKLKERIIKINSKIKFFNNNRSSKLNTKDYMFLERLINDKKILENEENIHQIYLLGVKLIKPKELKEMEITKENLIKKIMEFVDVIKKELGKNKI